MTKKIAALAATVLSMFVLAFTPAHAANFVGSNDGDCVTSGGSAPADRITILAYDENQGVRSVYLKFDDSNMRTWNWKLYHNGNVSFKGSFDLGVDTNPGDDSIRVIRDTADFVGTDRLRYEVINASGTVVCNARIGIESGN